MAFGHKAFTKSRPNRGRMSKIWVEVYAKVECSTKRRIEGRVEGRIHSRIQRKSRIEGRIFKERRLERRHTQTTSTSTNTDDFNIDIHTNHVSNSSNSRPFLEKNDFLTKFSIQRFGIVESFPYICRTKDIRQAHSRHHPHTIECFSRRRDIYQQRASSK